MLISQKIMKYFIMGNNIESKGKKTGNCDFRLMFANKMVLFDQYTDGKNKSYGKCTYEGKEINVDIYRP